MQIIRRLLATDAELREVLAALAHEQWSGWMRYLFGKCSYTDMGDAVIPKSSVLHWQRQVGTPYADLSEAEKESDRKEADRVLAALREAAGVERLSIACVLAFSAVCWYGIYKLLVIIYTVVRF